ncbi:hypothetical protein [Dyadobacter sp. NIV53]|uniref:hypothetical protein n=1 Tax=Dyadobacter sp. NIV53 TaxID=2861765 RepID=UPI001C87DEA9|nr:hypothetical protein [Dyadobacter sp. NIV53]
MKLKSLKNQAKTSKYLKGAFAGILACGLLSACGGSSDKGSQTDSLTTEKDTAAAIKSVKPLGEAPAWAPDIKPEMQAVIEKLMSYKDAPIPNLTAQEARKNHTPTNAVMDLIKENNIPVPAPMVDTTGKKFR